MAMTLSNARASTGLSADATPAGTLVSGPAVIGTGHTVTRFTDPAVAWAMVFGKITNTSTGSLVVATGAASVTGSATVADGDGKDFEGAALAAITTVQGVHIRRSDANAGDVSITGASGAIALLLPAGAQILRCGASGLGATLAGATLALANSTTAEATVEITVIGK